MAERIFDDSEDYNEGEGQVLTEEEVQVKKPNLYRVFLLNDDYTPMDFVVHVLHKIYHKAFEEATRLMWKVHTEGQGLCGIFTYDVAQTKVYQTKALARKHQHPLECIMEVEQG